MEAEGVGDCSDRVTSGVKEPTTVHTVPLHLSSLNYHTCEVEVYLLISNLDIRKTV